MKRLAFEMPADTAPNALKSTPFAIFAICLAFLGLGLCWRFAPYPGGIGQTIATPILMMGMLLTGTAFLCQGLRVLQFRDAVWEELRDPVRGPIALQPVIALQLIAEAIAGDLPNLTNVLVVVTTCAAVGGSVVMLPYWLRSKEYFRHQTPTWLIPGISLGVASLLCATQHWTTAADLLFRAPSEGLFVGSR